MNRSEEAIDLLITVLFAIDILLTFNTAFLNIKTEKYVFDRKAIAVEYCKFWFWVDMAATVPFDTIAESMQTHGDISAVRIIRIFRLARLAKIYRAFKQKHYLENLRINPAIVNVVVLLMQIFFIAHIFACFWHFITLPGAVGSFNSNWIDTFGFTQATTGTRYVASFYYVIVTMLTVGYGDIYATNQLERMYAILTMLTGGVVFGALVAKVAGIIDNRNPQARAYNEKMKELKLFLVDTGLPMPIRDKAKVRSLFFSLCSVYNIYLVF